jgi:hypothetical protein
MPDTLSRFQPVPDPSRAPRILLAEDEKLVRNTIRLVLSREGYQILEAVDGEDAVRRYFETTPPPELLMFDMDMPRLNGLEALARIRARVPAVKAILLSGGNKVVDTTGVIYVTKPFDNEELLLLVRHLLEG